MTSMNNRYYGNLYLVIVVVFVATIIICIYVFIRFFMVMDLFF